MLITAFSFFTGSHILDAVSINIGVKSFCDTNVVIRILPSETNRDKTKLEDVFRGMGGYFE